MNQALTSFEHYPYEHRLPMKLGPYTLVELLGQGGMGAVYRGYREGAGGHRFDVAVKVVRDSVLLASDDTLRAALAREAEIARGLSHSNVLHVQDFGEHHGIPYVVTDLLRGQSADALSAAGKLSPGQAVRLVYGLVRGLAYMHAQTPPLVHRDVKPSNVFVTEQGDVKVVDYGLSKAVSTSSLAQSAAHGTTPYMSPERYAGRVSPQADVFAVGAVAYELITGRRLLDGSEVDPASGVVSEPSPIVVMKQAEHVEQHLLSRDAIAAVDAKVPGLGAILLKCLRRDPAERFKDCGELEEALEPLDRRVGASLKGVARAPAFKAPTTAPPQTPNAMGATVAPSPMATVPAPPPAAVKAPAPKPARTAWYVAGGGLLIAGVVGLVLARPCADAPRPVATTSATDTGTVVAAAEEIIAATADALAGAAAEDTNVAAAELVAIEPLPPLLEAPEGFVMVVAGEFSMGSTGLELGREPDEAKHQVTLTRPFFLQATEVTQAQWERVMGTKPSRFPACGQQCPVENVSWFDAIAYLNALSRREGLEVCYDVVNCQGTVGAGCATAADDCDSDYVCDAIGFKGLDCAGYRLPTEAEWEYAARAGTQTATYSGFLRFTGDDHHAELDPIAWYERNSVVTYQGAAECNRFFRKVGETFPFRCGPHPVGLKKANAFGLHDMLGNVWEWTNDLYREELVDATDPSVPEPTAGTGANRVVRGASWRLLAPHVRAAFRNAQKPTKRTSSLGFRPARTSP